MYKTVESNESMRSEDSGDRKSRYKYKKRFEPDEMETESQTWKKNSKRTQKDTGSTMHNSGNLKFNAYFISKVKIDVFSKYTASPIVVFSNFFIRHTSELVYKKL